ncbi:hypothetical protein [Cohnella caldifontis]|nr:hypothetical protein [Cohnella sp. YIM B05605]
MNGKSNGRKRWTWLAIAAMVAAGLLWTAAHPNDGRMEEARRIIVYSTTS